jgi:hypothetical protein
MVANTDQWTDSMCILHTLFDVQTTMESPLRREVRTGTIIHGIRPQFDKLL